MEVWVSLVAEDYEDCVPQKSRLLWGDKEAKLKRGGHEDRPVKHNPMTMARDLRLGVRRIAGQST
jgi:hypothetical protein